MMISQLPPALTTSAPRSTAKASDPNKVTPTAAGEGGDLENDEASDDGRSKLHVVA